MMAAGTVTIAGKAFPKTYLYVGGAVVAGIVGYAWWTKGGGLAVEPEPEEVVPTDEFGDERITPNTIDTYDVSVDNRTGIKTNAEWAQFVRDDLSGRSGYDSGVVSAAVGKYLARKPLTTAEVSIIQQAVAVGGEPPEGRPWYILPEGPSGAAVAPGPVTGLKLVSATPTSVTISWSATQGASGYELRRDGGGTARKDANTRTHTSSGLRPNTSYRFGVRSVNSANNFGPEAYITVKTTAQGTTSGGGSIGAPSRVIATADKRAKIGLLWAPVPGATGYRIRREGSGPGVTSGWQNVGNRTNYVATARFSKPTQVRIRVQAMKGSTPGGNTLSNPVVVKP